MTKTISVQKQASSTLSTVESAQPFWLLRAGTAQKVGKQSTGAISYQIVADSARASLSIAIVGNATGGYFSREQVAIAKIESCLSHAEAGKPIASKAFKGAFVGRSANNAGFLAAVLRAEGLLSPAAEAEIQHLIAGDWLAWQAAALAEPGRLIEPANTPADASQASPAAPEHKRTLSVSRKKGS